MNSELEDEGCREAVQRLQARFAESSHGLRPAVIDSTGRFFGPIGIDSVRIEADVLGPT